MILYAININITDRYTQPEYWSNERKKTTRKHDLLYKNQFTTNYEHDVKPYLSTDHRPLGLHDISSSWLQDLENNDNNRSWITRRKQLLHIDAQL